MAGPPPSSPSLVRVYRPLSSGHLGPPAGTLRGGPPTMSTRDVALVSTSVVVGALASAFAVRFLSGYWAKSSSDEIDSLAVDTDRPLENSSVQSPFDPSKRKGFFICRIPSSFFSFPRVLVPSSYDFVDQVPVLGRLLHGTSLPLGQAL